ncbi:hypothetical protein NKJ45_32130 [Mesorhizobium sp. M0103]
METSIIRLHPVAAAIAKRKDRRRKWVKLHHLLHQDRKAVDAGPKVDGLAVQVAAKQRRLWPSLSISEEGWH